MTTLFHLSLYKSEREVLQDASETCCDVWFVTVALTKRQKVELEVEVAELKTDQDGQD